MGLSQKSLLGLKKDINYESLERLEGKTGEGPFFKVRSDRKIVCEQIGEITALNFSLFDFLKFATFGPGNSLSF